MVQWDYREASRGRELSDPPRLQIARCHFRFLQTTNERHLAAVPTLTQRHRQRASKRSAKKGADWIVANDVSGDVMGGSDNSVHIVSAASVESWERLPKSAVAQRLAERIAAALDFKSQTSRSLAPK